MLERFVEKAAKDPAYHGEMFRMVLDSELILIVPADQPLLKQGADRFNSENPLQVSRFSDAGGPFYPVFTSMTAADQKISLLPNRNAYAAVGISARAAFQLVHDGETPVRLLSQGPARFILQPEAVKSLLDGEFTESDPNAGETRTFTLMGVETESLPSELLETIRRFCDNRPVPLGVYAFVAQLPDSQDWDDSTVHFFLWLRETDPSFFNDFQLMVRALSKNFVINFMAHVADSSAMDLLKQSQPIWPIIGMEKPGD